MTEEYLIVMLLTWASGIRCGWTMDADPTAASIWTIPLALGCSAMAAMQTAKMFLEIV